jgi:hypothetical protein
MTITPIITPISIIKIIIYKYIFFTYLISFLDKLF